MFEPCGLTQLVAMRYGALPVVRRTGGLADTVIDLDSGASHVPLLRARLRQPAQDMLCADPEGGNGFVFDGVDEGSLNSALDRALQLHRSDLDRWQAVAARNMQADSSWEKSAAEYISLYNSVIAS